MKTRMIFLTCLASLMVACSQKQTMVSLPMSHIDVEQLKDSIDYNMDVTGLPLSDLRVLRNAPAARLGYPFKDAYLRGIYSTTTWYDSLMWKFDEQLETLDWSKFPEKENEDWRDHYYRVSDEAGLVKYTQQELDFMKRLKERENELLKQNFDVPEGLRVNMQNLVNPTQLKEFDSLLCQRLGEDGFAIVPANHDQLFHVYEQNDYNEFPSFVTTDLFLQLYHLYFDCMLRELEENHLMQMMINYTRDMHEVLYNMERWSGNDETIKRIAHHNAAYYNIAHKLFTGKYIFEPAAGSVEIEEVNNAMAAENSFSNFMEDYKEITFPYSLFRPRGHYTRSEKLQCYFRGMMWLQTASFGMNHKDELLAAIMQACALKLDKKSQNNYNRLNSLITFLMGKPDNLSLMQVMAEVEKTGLQMEDLLHNDEAIAKITATLEEIGNKQTRIRPKFEKTSHNKINVMPQRYQPDAEVLQEMVDYDNKPTLRATPKGLDFFATMQVSAAEQILIEEGQKWKGFAPMLKKMKQRMQQINWNETIATQWMSTLRTLCDRDPQLNLPYFMVTPEWNLKDLNAMLASWAELKHDAILYAKQPMGAECGGGGPPAPVVKGYVEPNISFWKKAISLLDNTAHLLKDEKMLTEKISEATERIREEAQFLLAISEKELAGKPLDDEEYDQIKCVGATFENISLDLVRQPDQYLMGWSDVQGADKKVALVADVYTANADNNPEKSILFEAVGGADEIYVVVEIGGYLYLTRGAVLSYREFIQPLNMPRLTDEEWQQQLEKNPRKGVPDWMNRIIVPLKKMPKPNEEYFYSSGC
ncbi:MAG: DUF3160 domain-containing protein [Prevotella sp.]|nr:DUF3160 domain-containing protein [Prevotella sp.]